MNTFQQNWARIAFPHPQPARKERLLPPLVFKQGRKQAEFYETCSIQHGRRRPGIPGQTW